MNETSHPFQPISAALAAHPVAIQALDQHPGDRILFMAILPRELRVEQEVEIPVREFGPIQRDRGVGVSVLMMPGIAAQPPVPNRFEHLTQKVVLDVAENGTQAALIAESEFGGLSRTESDEFLVVPKAVEGPVIRSGYRVARPGFPNTPLDAPLPAAPV